MPFDTELVADVRALADVVAIATNKRIYHEEVLQGVAFDNFPCVAYSLLSDQPVMELAGDNSGYRTATFTFACYSKKSEETRTLAAAIQSLTGTRDKDTGDVIEWIEAEDTTDSFNPPIDLDEKGLKAAEITVVVVYSTTPQE